MINTLAVKKADKLGLSIRTRVMMAILWQTFHLEI